MDLVTCLVLLRVMFIFPMGVFILSCCYLFSVPQANPSLCPYVSLRPASQASQEL